jgi:tetratricopeptide (TPR) repeat protein
VRVTAELARLDGVSLWSETYDRPSDDLYALQGDIASSVAALVQSGVARTDAAPRATPDIDPRAYDDYLRGHYLLARRGGASLRQAIALFESAVSRDSAFARAFAELAQANAVLPLYTGGDRESQARAERAVTRAMILDSSLAPAHAVMGYLHNVNWRWAEGRRSLERAVSLDSSDATALQWLGENLMMTGQFARARDVYALAQRADRESPIIPSLLAVTQALSGDGAQAERTGRAVVDANPSQAVPRFMMGTLLAYLGKYTAAISELREARRLAPSVLAVAGSLGYALAKSGDASGARAQLAELRRSPNAAGVDGAIAKILVAMGDLDGAMAALRRGAAAHDTFFSSEPLASPIFAPLRSHRDYPLLLTQLGLDEKVPAFTKR